MSRDLPIRRVVIEGITIVFSILVAFAADAWWQERGDRRDAAESLRVVRTDLASGIAHLEELRTHVQEGADAAFTAYTAMVQGVPEDERDQVEEHLRRSASRRTMRLPSTGYREIVSTGGLSLISDGSIREALISFYESAVLAEAIIEKNTGLFLDTGLSDALYREGFLIPKGLGEVDLDVVDTREAMIEARFGEGFEHPRSRIWMLDPAGADYARIMIAVLRAARTAVTTDLLVGSLIQEATDLDAAIANFLGG